MSNKAQIFSTNICIVSPQYFCRKTTNSTIFKTWLSDINKVALALDGLNGITQFKTGSTIANGMQLSDVAVNKYKASIEGLSLSQAEAALSATALNEEQRKQILMSAGLITSTDSVTAAEVKQTVAENVLTTAKQQEVLATFEAEIAEGKMSLERLQAIALEDTEAGAIARIILAKKGENAQNLKNIASGKALNTVLKEQLVLLLKNPLTWVVIATGAVIGLVKVVEELVVTEEELNEQIEELQSNWSELSSTIQSSAQSFQSLKKQADELIPRYAELAQGVDKYGKNVSLTDEEFSEFVSLNNQLGQMFPELVMGYDSNGNAILALSGNVDTLTESLYAFVEAQRIASAQTIADTMPEVMSNIDSTVESYEDLIQMRKDEMEDLKELYEAFKNDGFVEEWSSAGESMVSAVKILNEYGIDYNSEITGERNGIVGSTRYKITVDWDDFETAFNGRIAGFEKEIDDLVGRIEAKWKQLNPVVSAWLSTDFLYQDLDMSGQSLVTAMVGEIDFKSLGLKTEEEIQNYITNSIITPIYDMDTKTQQAFFEVFDLHEALNKGELSVQEYQDKINAILENGTYSQEFTTIFKLAFAEGDLQEEYDKAIAKFGEDNKNTLAKFFTDNSINTTEEIEYWNKVTDGAQSATEAVEMYNKVKSDTFNNEITVSFSEAFNSADFSEQKEKLLDLAKSGELTEETLSSTEEYKTLLDDTGLSAELVKDKIYELLTAQEKLAGAHNGLDDLSNSYKEFKDLGFVTAQTLEGLPDVFKSLEGFDVFSQIVGNPESGVDAIQNAFNNIVKEYLLFTQTLNSDSLFGDNIEEQERAINTYIANLKQMGITNAEEVVNQTVSSMKQQQTLLDNAEQEYIDYLRGNEEDYMGYLKAKNNIDLQYIESTASYNSQFINSLGQGYETDYNNWLGLLRDKEIAYQRYVKSLDGDGDGKFIYDPNKDVAGNLIANGKDASASNIVDFYTAKAEYERISKKYEDLRNTLSFNPVFSNNFSANWDGSSLSSGSGSKNSDNEFDWIETKLDILNDKLEKTKETAQDSFSDWIDRDKAFKDADKQIDDLIAKEKEAKARYLAEARKVGLTEKDENGISYTTLIQQGAIDIDKISNDTLKEKIQSYQEYWDKVKECDEAVIQLNKDSLQLDRDYREFKWEIFDYLQDSISRLTDEADYLIELLSNKDLFDNNGNLTKYADATLGLHISNYKTYMQKASDYAEEIKDLEKQLANGGQEVLDKYNERIDAHQDAILGAQQEKQAMLDLVEQGYQKQLDALNEAIDKKKELWNIEKGLFDYQQSIAEKTKNIAILEKRKFALSGDSSQEAKAQLQQIEVELSEARKDLEQTEYEKMISDTESMLDSLSD